VTIPKLVQLPFIDIEVYLEPCYNMDRKIGRFEANLPVMLKVIDHR
jgi:hypothetical protein